mgnify:CR=1 FL=1
MSDKMIGVTKAAIAGAFFGSAVGMVAVPKTRKGKRHTLISDVTGTLGISGTAMKDVSEYLKK